MQDIQLQKKIKIYRNVVRLLVAAIVVLYGSELALWVARRKTDMAVPPFHLYHAALMTAAWMIEFLIVKNELLKRAFASRISVFIWMLAAMLEGIELYNIVSHVISQPDAGHLYQTFTIVSQSALLAMILSLNAAHLIAIKTVDEEEMASYEQFDNNNKSAWQKFKLLTPFLFPKKSLLLQLLVVLSFMMLIAGRLVNLLVPVQYKKVIDTLTGGVEGHFPWSEILLFILFRFLQGGVGLLSSAQSSLWIKVGQCTTRGISLEMFKHLHDLSLTFHLNRKTGEVLRVMDRGTSSIVNLLNSILFNIVPTLVDIGIACVFFVLMFDIWFGLIVFITMASYIMFTILITEWRASFRRAMNDQDNKLTTKAVDSLLNFETVKYYGAEKYELENYESILSSFQRVDLKNQLSLYLLNTTQNVVITVGLLVGCILCISEIMDKEMTVGDFVLFLAYITQLYGPLNWFGTYYRVIQQNFVDMEKLFELFDEKPEVQDAENAKTLIVKKGEIEFDNVSFSYHEGKAALKNISLKIAGGSVVAFVGPSGSGKSTLVRLLFRFYDVPHGRIIIDGQDVKSVTCASLRQAMGVVPQDTVLFNETVKYNIGYGKIGASDHEIEEACKAAQIHDRIKSFPDGYETRVGERGLRLSGGEKQRVAIARTLLKNPPIVILDEATSALDSNTERQIHDSLIHLTKGKTTIVVAHRLSTIVHADQIFVLENGSIVERGTHSQLVKLNSLYASMWKKQLSKDKAIADVE